MRSGGIVGQDGPEFLFGHPAGFSLIGDAIAEALELRRVEPPQAVIFLRRQQHRYIAFLTTNDDRFLLGCVKKSGKTLLRVRGEIGGEGAEAETCHCAFQDRTKPSTFSFPLCSLETARWRGCGGLGKRDPCCPWASREAIDNSFACSATPKFALEGREIEEILALYRPFVVPVLAEPKADASVPKCQGPDDQKFLDLAHRAKALALVTGDRVLPELSREVPFHILTPAQLRGRLEGRENE